MNLDDIKKNWKEIDDLSKESNISDTEIQAMIQKRDRQNRIKVFIPEVIIILIYVYLIIMLILFNSQFSETLYKILSWISVLVLFLQIGLIYFTTRTFYKQMILPESYAQTIDHVIVECEKLNQAYYLILGLNFVILCLSIVLLPKVYSENPSFSQSLIAIAIGLIVLGFLSFKMYRYYKNLILRNNYLKRKLER